MGAVQSISNFTFYFSYNYFNDTLVPTPEAPKLFLLLKFSNPLEPSGKYMYHLI
jgi:hypothetical protein